jgi:hypothetical protein
VRAFPVTRVPRSHSRHGVKRDNVALVPASLLPCKEHRQRVTNALSHGGILIVLPRQANPQRVAGAVESQITQQGQLPRIIARKLQETASPTDRQ